MLDKLAQEYKNINLTRLMFMLIWALTIIVVAKIWKYPMYLTTDEQINCDLYRQWNSDKIKDKYSDKI